MDFEEFLEIPSRQNTQGTKRQRPVQFAQTRTRRATLRRRDQMRVEPVAQQLVPQAPQPVPQQVVPQFAGPEELSEGLRRGTRDRKQAPLRGQNVGKISAEREEAMSKKRILVKERGNAELLKQLNAKKNKLGREVYNLGIGAELDKTLICNWKLLQLANGIFQPDFLTLNFTRITTRGELRTRVRGLWEFSSPDDQCINVIRRPGETEENKKCWLCDGMLDPNAKGLLEPSCDHVLPIAQAAMFLELFKNPEAMKRFLSKGLKKPPSVKPSLSDTELDAKVKKFEEKLTRGTPSKLMKLEYAWAHRGCNLSKQDMVFIQLNPSDARNNIVTWELNTKTIKDALERVLADSRTENIPVRKNGFPTTKEAWIKKRAEGMAEHKLNDIVKFLNSSKFQYIDSLANDALTKCIDTSDPRALQYIREKSSQVNAVTEAIVGSQATTIGSEVVSELDSQSQPSTKRRRLGQGRKRNRKTRRVREH